MHEYDVAFKLILQQSVDVAIREIAGTTIAKWLNVELPEVRNTRVDLLGETEGRDLIHIELQSTNDPTMPLRMAEYCLRVFRDVYKRQLSMRSVLDVACGTGFLTQNVAGRVVALDQSCLLYTSRCV